MNPLAAKKKVIHVITRFDKGGSAENTFLTVCGLDKDHYEIVLVTGRPLQRMGFLPIQRPKRSSLTLRPWRCKAFA
jgi:hypothetical protein